MKLSELLKQMGVKLPDKLPIDSYGHTDDDYVAKCCAEHGNALIEIISNLDVPDVMSIESIKEAISGIPSTHVPISNINGKHYYYMNKRKIAETIHVKLINNSKDKI